MAVIHPEGVSYLSTLVKESRLETKTNKDICGNRGSILLELAVDFIRY